MGTGFGINMLYSLCRSGAFQCVWVTTTCLLIIGWCATSCKQASLQVESTQIQKEAILYPTIDGAWWVVASNPDLGTLSTGNQQPVDFGIWEASDGSWQIWSCIRHTGEGGKTRLFHRWEGLNLTDTAWMPMGITFRADPGLGEQEGGMQAPYVIKNDREYLMFYGDWNRICLARSMDGKNFNRVLRKGSPALFGELAETNTRDSMVLQIDTTWYCYYTAHPNNIGAVYVRTSDDLISWSSSIMVAFGGQAGNDKFWYAECPFVVNYDNYYYHFRTQSYGQGLKNKGKNIQKTSVYRSNDPTNFGIEDDRFFLRTLPISAPEIIENQGVWYIAALTPDLDGIRIARLKWSK